MLKKSGSDAFSQALRNKSRRYPGRDDARYDDHLIFPDVTPTFAMTRGQTVFTIGSCFARNVEDVLVANGMNVPTTALTAPQDEAPGRPNRILNQYNPATMLHAVESAGTVPNDHGLYQVGPDAWVDTLLATGSRAVTRDRAHHRRADINALYDSGLAASDVVVITLGLIEAWFDAQTGIYLNEAPPHKIIKSQENRFEFHQLGVDECRTLITTLLDRIVDGGRRRVVMTVSPVPLQATFAGGDAVVRNSYSKSVLRVVAELAAQSFATVDYYPSYEIITTSGLRSYGEDNVHVRPKVVERVVNHMVNLYTS